jgi:hypothetical protein
MTMLEQRISQGATDRETADEVYLAFGYTYHDGAYFDDPNGWYFAGKAVNPGNPLTDMQAAWDLPGRVTSLELLDDDDWEAIVFVDGMATIEDAPTPHAAIVLAKLKALKGKPNG